MTAAVRPAYYNEWDPYCAAWLRNLVAAGHIAPGGLPGPVTARKRRSPVTAFAGRARVDGGGLCGTLNKSDPALNLSAFVLWVSPVIRRQRCSPFT